jgi:hypothetical protein
MACTQIIEPSEPPHHGWQDNFVCLPVGSRWSLTWSFSGPVPGLHCLRFNEPSDPHTWQDNFLCWDRGW